MLIELELEPPLKASIVRCAKLPDASASRLRRFSRFDKDEDEMESFEVLTWKRSRSLLVIPAVIVRRMQTKLAMVRPKGKATHMNLPTPMVMLL